jgi:hypothetical protein
MTEEQKAARRARDAARRQAQKAAKSSA